jgi:hypothetical protein
MEDAHSEKVVVALHLTIVPPDRNKAPIKPPQVCRVSGQNGKPTIAGQPMRRVIVPPDSASGHNPSSRRWLRESSMETGLFNTTCSDVEILSGVHQERLIVKRLEQRNT